MRSLEASAGDGEGARPPYGSYKEFLESYSRRRYAPVRPPAPPRTMKSEIFIRVNEPGASGGPPAPEPGPPAAPDFLENLLRRRSAAARGADEADRPDKNDPNVKRLVYSTYRGLLGAYNGKANGIVSTLPRHCVREDRGVGRQLESIALQGGLDKLNGRVHPDYRDKD